MGNGLDDAEFLKARSADSRRAVLFCAKGVFPKSNFGAEI
jgi:hypothetical protein